MDLQSNTLKDLYTWLSIFLAFRNAISICPRPNILLVTLLDHYGFFLSTDINIMACAYIAVPYYILLLEKHHSPHFLWWHLMTYLQCWFIINTRDFFYKNIWTDLDCSLSNSFTKFYLVLSYSMQLLLLQSMNSLGTMMFFENLFSHLSGTFIFFIQWSIYCLLHHYFFFPDFINFEFV